MIVPGGRAAFDSMDERQEQVTRLLQGGLGKGSKDELLGVVYDELRSIAERRMSSERAGHTLQATALVHEAYVRLVGDEHMEWEGRKHFYGAAAEAMRRVLIDHARKVQSQKRGGNQKRVTLGAAELSAELDADQILALHDALESLEREDPRAAEVTRLRFLGGLSVEETAKMLDVSERTVHREWTFARARLFEILDGG